MATEDVATEAATEARAIVGAARAVYRNTGWQHPAAIAMLTRMIEAALLARDVAKYSVERERDALAERLCTAKAELVRVGDRSVDLGNVDAYMLVTFVRTVIDENATLYARVKATEAKYNALAERLRAPGE